MTDVQGSTSEYVDDLPNGTGPLVDTIEDRKQKARELVQVLPGRGITPENFAAFVTVAQGMCRPENIWLKEDLRSNVPVVIGLLDLAVRSRLSVYLLAMKAYVQKGVLCFESQAFHALARPFLDGGLKGEWINEGNDRVLIVRGRLKHDPFEYEHRSPKLSALHPGHTTKHVNGEAMKFVRGSPLWDRKPDVQLWYDTTRDWIRMYCPEAVMGIYTVEEVMDDSFIDATPRPTLGERLQVSERPELREGFRPMEVAGTVQQATVADEVGEEMAVAPIPAPVPNYIEQEKPKKTPARKVPEKKPRRQAGKPVQRLAPKAKGKEPPTPKTPPRPAQPARKAPASKADRTAEWAVYIEGAQAWIKSATDPDAAAARWDEEYDARNAVELPIEDRNKLRALLEERVEQLRSGR